MNLSGVSAEDARQQAADTISKRMASISEYSPVLHLQVVNALKATKEVFGDVATSRCVEAANTLLERCSGAGIGKRRQAEVEQKVPAAFVLEILSQRDWEILKDESIGVNAKLVRLGRRFSKYGIKHLGQSSRRGPICLLALLHYGKDAIGTASCTYHKLHDHTVSLANFVKNNGKDDVPGPYICEFPSSYDELADDLKQFAQDEGDPIIAADLEHYKDWLHFRCE